MNRLPGNNNKLLRVLVNTKVNIHEFLILLNVWLYNEYFDKFSDLLLEIQDGLQQSLRKGVLSPILQLLVTFYYFFIFILYLYSAYYSVDSKRLWHSFLICATLINLRPLGAILARRRWGAHATVPDTLCGEGTTEPYSFSDVGSFTCPGMALPVHGTSIYSMMRTAPYSILSMPSAWQGSSMYHF